MSIELKIKSKHLSEEARIIRFEEKKQLKNTRYKLNKLRESGHNGDLNLEACELNRSYFSLNHHRRWDVRNENRATFLARAFLENKPYVSVEQKRKSENEYTFRCYIVPRVLTMINKYGNNNLTKEQLLEWCKLE